MSDIARARAALLEAFSALCDGDRDPSQRELETSALTFARMSDDAQARWLGLVAEAFHHYPDGESARGTQLYFVAKHLLECPCAKDGGGAQWVRDLADYLASAERRRA